MYILEYMNYNMIIDQYVTVYNMWNKTFCYYRRKSQTALIFKSIEDIVEILFLLLTVLHKSNQINVTRLYSQWESYWRFTPKSEEAFSAELIRRNLLIIILRVWNPADYKLFTQFYSKKVSASNYITWMA